jgi:hypothetical protein
MKGSVKHRPEHRETRRIYERTRKTRLEKIEKILDQLALKKGESEKNKRESYAEAVIRGSKAAST